MQEKFLIKTFAEVNLASLTLRTHTAFSNFGKLEAISLKLFATQQEIVNLDRNNWAKFSGNLVENIIILVFFSKSYRKWPKTA